MRDTFCQKRWVREPVRSAGGEEDGAVPDGDRLLLLADLLVVKLPCLHVRDVKTIQNMYRMSFYLNIM